MTDKKLNKTTSSIVTGLQEAILYANNELKAKTHNIIVPSVDYVKS